MSAVDLGQVERNALRLREAKPERNIAIASAGVCRYSADIAKVFECAAVKLGVAIPAPGGACNIMNRIDYRPSCTDRFALRDSAAAIVPAANAAFRIFGKC